MIGERQQNAIREKFRIASDAFDFHFISPYCLDEELGLYAFGCLYRDPAKRIVIDFLNDDFSHPESARWCRLRGQFYSCLNPAPLLDKYDSEYFAEMLNDWKYDL